MNIQWKQSLFALVYGFCHVVSTQAWSEFTPSVTGQATAGEITLTGRNHQQVLETDGLGLGIGFSYITMEDKRWSVFADYGEQDAEETWNPPSRAKIRHDEQYIAVGASYAWEDWWTTAQWQQTSIDLTYQGPPGSIAKISEETTEKNFSLELGKDWYWDDWGYSLGGGFNYQDSHAELYERGIIADEILAITNSKLNSDGIDLLLVQQLSYFYPMAEEAALSPMLSLAYQHNISGDLTSFNRTTARTRNGTVRTTQSRQESQLEEDNELSLGVGLSFIYANWLASISYGQPLLNTPKDGVLQLSINYQFSSN